LLDLVLPFQAGSTWKSHLMSHCPHSNKTITCSRSIKNTFSTF